MSCYKLYYFDIRGRAELTRLVLTAAGVRFKDIRFSPEEWASKYKAMSPTGVAPFLEDPVSGKTLVQSNAIAALLATRHGFGCSNPFDTYLVTRMMNQLKDIEDIVVPTMPGYLPEAQRAACVKEFLKTKGPYQFSILAKYLKDSGSKFVAGKSLTLADLALLNGMEFFPHIDPGVEKLLARHPELTAHSKHVLESNQKLVDYLAARKPSPT